MVRSAVSCSSILSKKDEESDARNDGGKSLTIRARIALMAALGLGLLAIIGLVLGPMADAQTAAVAAAENTKTKDAKSKDSKSKDSKSKDAKSKDAKSKDAKSKDSKS